MLYPAFIIGTLIIIMTQENNIRQEWTMKPSDMDDWMESVSCQSLEILHRFAELETAHQVLEIGAGRGTYSVRALHRMPSAQQQSQLWLTDYSPEMVVELQKVAKNNADPRIRVERINAMDLSPLFTENSLDVYLANLVLHHTSDGNVALQQAKWALKSGGRLCLAEVDAENMGQVFNIPQQAMAAAGIDSTNHHNHNHGHANESKTEAEAHHNHNHGHATETKTEAHHNHGHANEAKTDARHNHNHNHGHANETKTEATSEHCHDEHKNDDHNDHEYAMRHGGSHELRTMVMNAGFDHVVTWHVDCVAETHDANRFAIRSMSRLTKKWEENNAMPTIEQQQKVLEEMRRLAQEELDQGRPIAFGVVIVLARKL